MEDWRPAPRSKQEDCVYTKGRKQYRVQHGQFCSKVFDTAAAAKKLGWQEYEERQDNKANDAARGVAKPPAAAAAAKPRRKQARKRKASPDASTDGILQLEIKQPLPQAAAAAGPPKGRKRGQQAAPAAAAQNKRQKKNNAASPAVRAGSQLATAFAQGDIPAEQTPSAATDAATMPQGKARKQPRKQPQHAAADADVPQAAAVDQRPAQAANKKRHRQAAAPATAEAPPPAAAAAAGGKGGRRPKRAVRRPAAAAAAAAREAEEGTDGDVQEGPAAAAEELYPGVPRDARGRVKPFGRAALQAMARARIIPPPAARARREAAAAKKGRLQSCFDSEDEEEEEDSQEDSEQQQQQGRKKPQHRRQQAAAATDSHGLTGTGMDWEQKVSLGQADTHTTSLSEESSEDHESEGSDLAPSSAAAAAAVQQQEPPPRTSESAGSNWVPPELPAAAAAAAAGGQHAPAAAAAVAPGEASTLHVWYQGSKSATCEGITLDLQFQQQLGKGGFGAVHKVLVKATGANSLAGLKLKGSLGNSLKTLIKEGRTKGNVGRGAAAAAGGGGSRQQSARSRAGSKGGGSNGGGSVGSNGGGGGGGSWVPMALKVALGFEQLSREMQDNFREASAFDTNVQQRMREEYDVMAACAASPHILDAFCMGTAWMGGSWRPCILMELSALGDAERVFITPANTLYGTGPRGVSAVVAQRIVRQAAVALKDLHSMAGSIHLDLKVNNLLVFGSKDAPQVKLCDFGCAKKRSDEPQYGPASGTKDWQAPEQMAADAQDGPVAGRLDFCTDSWALGLLVLGLRKGQQPFWWLKQEGKLPSEMPDALRSSLSSPSSPYAQDSPRGSKLTRAELAFVTTCMASSSSSRPDVRDLLDHQSYLSSRYRGG